MNYNQGGFAMPSAPQSMTNLPPSNSLPTSTVELSVKCTDLADKDILSKSDPICVMFMQRNNQWFEVGRTEMIKDNLENTMLALCLIQVKAICKSEKKIYLKKGLHVN